MSQSQPSFKKMLIDNQPIIYLILVIIGFTLALLSKLLPIFPALTLKALADANITELLNGAIFITLIVERSLEVFISVWREPEKINLQNQINESKFTNLEGQEVDGTSEQNKPANPTLIKYQGNTKILAFYVGLFLGIISALVGVRLLEPLVDLTKITDANQRNAFYALDIVLTGLVISGGSKVFHELISVFTDFLVVTRNRIDASKEKG